MAFLWWIVYVYLMGWLLVIDISITTWSHRVSLTCDRCEQHLAHAIDTMTIDSYSHE